MTKEEMRKLLESKRAEIDAIKAEAKAIREKAKAIREEEKRLRAETGADRRYSRVDSTTDVLSDVLPATFEEIAETADDLYRTRTGKAKNERESLAVLRYVIEALINVGYLSYDPGSEKYDFSEREREMRMMESE